MYRSFVPEVPFADTAIGKPLVFSSTFIRFPAPVFLAVWILKTYLVSGPRFLQVLGSCAKTGRTTRKHATCDTKGMTTVAESCASL